MIIKCLLFEKFTVHQDVVSGNMSFVSFYSDFEQS